MGAPRLVEKSLVVLRSKMWLFKNS